MKNRCSSVQPSAVSKITARLALFRLGLFVSMTSPLFGQGSLTLPAVFGDHMVLQAGKGAACWGQAAAGDTIEVAFQPEKGSQAITASARAETDGHWLAHLPPLAAGQKGTLAITTSSGQKKIISDVLVGEVWLASGQSNMGFSLSRSSTAKEALAQANQPEIRLFRVTQLEAAEPRNDVQGAWVAATPQTAGSFSAVAWFFGARLHEALKTPVGLIQGAWGGTPIETWLSAGEMKAFPGEAERLQRAYEQKMADFPAAEEQYARQLDEWKHADPGQPEAAAPKPPEKPRSQNQASRCYNAMIHGLQPFTLRGVVWYQGESNSGSPDSYRKLFPALVTSWRQSFQQPDLFFFYVELAGYAVPGNAQGGWARIRESQESVLALPKTGVATAIDVGAANDIHPTNKQPVGERLALLAQGEAYGKTGLHQSPQFAKATLDGSKIRVSLDHASGLRSRTPEIQGFVIQASDGTWQSAQAAIEGEQVLVWSAQVPEPKAVRYAWESNPPISLENAAGLPLRPFRSDR